MRFTPPYFRCSGIILSGPGALFEARELMASSTSDVMMSASRLCTFLARDAHDAIAMEVEVEDSENRRRHQNKSRDIEDG